MEKEKQAESRSNQQISETRSRIDKIQVRRAFAEPAGLEAHAL